MRRAIWVALALLWSALPAQAEDVFTFRVQSLHSKWVKVEFYSKSRNAAWPGNNMSWDLRDDDLHHIRLSCNRGEQICFGAWEHTDGNPQWGTGRGGKAGCNDCCWTCENGKQSQVIVMSFERSPRTKRMIAVHRVVSTHAKKPRQSPVLPPTKFD